MGLGLPGMSRHESVGNMVLVNVKTDGIVHGVLGVPLLGFVQGGRMLLVAGVYLENAQRCQVTVNAGRGGRGKLQCPVFIGAEPLFPDVYQHILGVLRCRFYTGEARGCNFLSHPCFRRLDGHAGIDMATVNPVEAGDMNPVFAKKAFQAFLGHDEVRFPFDAGLTRIENLPRSSERGRWARRPGQSACRDGDDYDAGRNQSQ